MPRFSVALFLLAPLLLSSYGPGEACAQHPTAVSSILNGESTPDTTLEVNHNGSLLAPGTYNPIAANDSVPAEGAGTRMMWYPAKAAFRAGRVGKNKDGTQWDADSTGNYSAAFGLDTKAGAENSVAMGWKTTANGYGALAMGLSTLASGTAALAMGDTPEATASAAVAMGAATSATNAATTAMGSNTTASGLVATAMGDQTTASGKYATALGKNTTAATSRSLSVGRCNSANQPSADGTLFVVGNGSLSSGNCLHSDALVLDTNGNLKISGTLTEGSDRRLKTAIEPLGDGTLQKLLALRPVRFEFENQRTHPSSRQIGLIAQDVQKEFPELVSTGSDGMLSLAYPKLSAVLMKGLQEQQAQIEEQRAQIAALEGENEKIRAENEEIKDRLAALEAQLASSRPAGLVGPWALAVLLGLGGLAGGLFWRRRPSLPE